MDDLLEKLEAIYQNWLVIADEITQPDVISDMKRYIKLNKDYKDLIPVVDAYKEYKNIVDNIANTKEIISTEKDEDFRELAKSELDVFLEQKESLEEKIRILLLP